jgi:AMMECR1 domain-containing protein
MKAGLMPDEWIDDKTKIYKFTGQIFTEQEPNGKIMEKSLDGFNS